MYFVGFSREQTMAVVILFCLKELFPFSSLFQQKVQSIFKANLLLCV